MTRSESCPTIGGRFPGLPEPGRAEGGPNTARACPTGLVDVAGEIIPASRPMVTTHITRRFNRAQPAASNARPITRLNHPQKGASPFASVSGDCSPGTNRLSLLQSTHFVSIPSEVGRGRALHVSAVDDTKVHRSVSFQSPRRWGGVGLPAYAEGHGANLDQSVSIPSEVGRGRALHVSQAVDDTKVHRSVSFQSPRRWGRGRALFHRIFPT